MKQNDMQDKAVADATPFERLTAAATIGNDACVFGAELSGFAAAAAVGELLENWKAALTDGNGDNLLEDIDIVVAQLGKFREKAAELLPAHNIGTGHRAAYHPRAELSEILSSLDGLGQSIDRSSIETDYVTRAKYMAEIALGMRLPFVESAVTNFYEAFGKRIRYVAHDNGKPLSVGVVEGLCICVQDTSGGNFRMRIETDQTAPQGGGKVEKLVYSHEGVVTYLEEHIEAKPVEQDKPRYKKHHADCPVCKTPLSSFSPNGFDIIYECTAPLMHHRHMVRGITGEYITMRPLLPSEVARSV